MHTQRRLLSLPHHQGKSLSRLYVAATLRTFVLNMLLLFMPIYLFDVLHREGYDLRTAFILIGVTSICLYAVGIVSVSLSTKILARFGLKSGFVLGQACMVMVLIISHLFHVLEGQMAAFALWALASNLWWLAYHSYFIEIGNRKEFGKELGTAACMGILAGAIAPVVAGVLISWLGFVAFFGVGIAASIVSVLVLTESHSTEGFAAASFDGIIDQAIRHKRDLLSFIGSGAEASIYFTAWPLLLLIIFHTPAAVGAFSSIVIVLSAVIALMAGRTVDRAPQHHIQRVGSGILGFSWIAKIFAQNPLGIVVFDTLYKISTNFVYIPLDAISYRHALATEKSSYLAFHETAYHTDSILGVMTFIIIIMSGLPFWLVFVAAALFALLPVVSRE